MGTLAITIFPDQGPSAPYRHAELHQFTRCIQTEGVRRELSVLWRAEDVAGVAWQGHRRGSLYGGAVDEDPGPARRPSGEGQAHHDPGPGRDQGAGPGETRLLSVGA